VWNDDEKKLLRDDRNPTGTSGTAGQDGFVPIVPGARPAARGVRTNPNVR
jgi:hypothetical protein